MATTSSGLTPRCGSRPNNFFTISCIFGLGRRARSLLAVAGQHARLNGCADGHYFVGVDAAMWLATEHLFDDLLNFGHARLAADEDHFVDFGDGDEIGRANV